MDYQLFKTADGSPTLYLPQWDEYYHSKHGAWQESKYVFIEQGLAHWQSNNVEKKQCAIFEMGFGTGLNALLTSLFAKKHELLVTYDTVEAFPLPKGTIAFELSEKENKLFETMHQTAWGQRQQLTSHFSLMKHHIKFENFKPSLNIDLIYYDAFGFRVQPEMWTPEILEPIINCLQPGGIFVTYAALGNLKRSLQAFGLRVERLPGAPGKRHMIRAERI